MMTETLTKKESILWAAGFFNGLGYIRYSIKCKQCKKKNSYVQYSIGINHNNIESLEAFQTVFGGKIFAKYTDGRKWEPVNMIHIRRIMRHIFPFISDEKQKQWADCLEIRKLYEEGMFV
jgi:hypothetical protein